jgi:hypothetical protein
VVFKAAGISVARRVVPNLYRVPNREWRKLLNEKEERLSNEFVSVGELGRDV